jgi:hypothetical protein
MSSIVQLRRRIAGTQATPAGNNEGELCLWFPTAAGGTEKPVLYANDGGGWREVNPTVAPQVKGILSTAAGGAVEDAFNAQAVTVNQGDIVVYTHPSTNGTAYVYTGGEGTSSTVSGAGLVVTTNANFTALGAAPQIATGAEIITGTDANKTVVPASLRAATANAPDATPANDADKIPRLSAAGLLHLGFLPQATDVEIKAGTIDDKIMTPLQLRTASAITPDATPANDADKLVVLGATGKIDPGFITFPASLTYQGNVDLTATYTAPGTPWNVGDFGVVGTSGPVYDATTAGAGTDWPLANLNPGQQVNQGDMVIWDGNNYNVLATEADLNAYVEKSGSTMSANAAINWPGAATAENGNVLLDLKGGTIDNAVINGGTY